MRVLAVFLLPAVFFGCQNQQVPLPSTSTALILPTVYPSETPTPVPTRTLVPTLSPTPLPKAVLQEPCISYYDLTNGDLKFTCYRNQNWRIETVDAAGDVGLYSSLAFDRFSNPHISYYSRSEQALKLASYDGSRWITEVVAEDETSGSFPSLAVGWDGTIYISYLDESQGMIRLARKMQNNWSHEDIDFIGRSSADDNLELFNTSLVLDPSGNPIVSFVDFENQYLKIARSDTNGQWVTEVVDSDTKAAWSNSLVLDGKGLPVISYQDANREVLMLVTLDGGEWKSEILDGSGDVGAFSSIALDDSSRIVAAYFDDNSDDIRFKNNSGVIPIETRSHIGWYLSMALDQEDSPWIAFHEASNRDLGIARFQNGRFRISYIATNGNVGYYPCLRFVPSYDTNTQ